MKNYKINKNFICIINIPDFKTFKEVVRQNVSEFEFNSWRYWFEDNEECFNKNVKLHIRNKDYSFQSTHFISDDFKVIDFKTYFRNKLEIE